MNDSELPEPAIEAAAGTWVFGCRTMAENRNVARAVLVAATERIECPACAHNDEPGTQWDWDTGTWRRCSRCAGAGFLFVLKTETP